MIDFDKFYVGYIAGCREGFDCDYKEDAKRYFEEWKDEGVTHWDVKGKKIDLPPYNEGLVLDRACLIEEEYDYLQHGIGVAFYYKGRRGRIAVLMPEDATGEDYRKAWKILMKATQNPEAEESKTAWDRQILIGNEIQFKKEE